jgi:agmatinase
MISCDNIKEADGIILLAGYGKSFTYGKGAGKGPYATIKCFSNNLEAFDRFTLNEPYKILKIGCYNLKSLHKFFPEKMVETVSDFVIRRAKEKKFVLMLGGDHSVSIGAFKAYANLYSPSEVTILQIDAHPDLRENTLDYRETSNPIDHACTMRRAIEMGFKTVQVGIRTISIYDYEFIKKNNLKVFEWGRDKEPKISDIIKSIKTKKVYLTFDIDGLDPAHAPGTGTPIPGGLSWNYAQELIRELISAKDLVGADIVEIAPKKDDILTPYTAAHLCYNIISYKLMKNKKMLKFCK